MYSMELVMVKT